MHKPGLFIRLLVASTVAAALAPSVGAQFQANPSWVLKLEPVLQQRTLMLTGRSHIVLRATTAVALPSATLLIKQLGGTVGRSLPIVDGVAADVPNPALAALAASSLVDHLSLDRLVAAANERTGATVGAVVVRQQSGYDGTGVGVAVIDSGVTSFHDDLAAAGAGPQRVDRFVDLVNGRPTAYDDYGHGTHVAGIVAGNGFDSSGRRSGIAPSVHLIVLKVLDSSGTGRISDVIAALDYAVVHKDELNIRVLNMSVAGGVYESYLVDPLTVAAERAVAAGIVVVAAAGNLGRNQNGDPQSGGITSPGNAPWVLTVGASSHMGTTDRADDLMAAFSSRGPTAIDNGAKPDLVAPGVGIESLSDPSSALYSTKSAYLLAGTVPTSYLPYLSLSGTSMAAPVVTGTVALMLQANPALTPNAVKAILQYTSEAYSGYSPLAEGAGFLDAKGAVELARYFASGGSYPASSTWSRRLVWGNSLASGGTLTPNANAWSAAVRWGAPSTTTGDAIQWGMLCDASNCTAAGATSAPWTINSGTSQKVTSGSGSSSRSWFSHGPLFSIIGTGDDRSTVVWGTTDSATVVWGTGDYNQTVVWGTEDEQTVVWGTTCGDPSCDTLWPTP
jgi:serine protease AprX